MASDVDICNLALAHLGDEANVVCIDPADQSAQAQYCARFYPLALSMVLTDHNWGFATRTVPLAQIACDNQLWPYCYRLPSDFNNVNALYNSDATDDVNHGSQQEFSVEINLAGEQVIYTRQSFAMLKYTAMVSNSAQFSPAFIEALSWRLASMLAGPILKGDVGVSAAKSLMQDYKIALANAALSDTQDRKVVVRHTPSGIAARA